MTPERFWSAYAASYDVIWDSPVTTETRERVHEELGQVTTVIDLGCGTGLMSIGLVQHGARVVGVDSSAAMLERAGEQGRVSQCVLASAEHVPLESATADAVIVGNLLHLHPDPAAVLTEARRLLAPGGVIVATWPVAGLTPSAIWRADRRSGRSLASTLHAQLLRVRVGLLAARTTGLIATRSNGTHDTGSLLAQLGLDPSQPLATVAECQHMLVLRD